MPVETSSMFAQVIQDHLELKERNAELERSMPLTQYKTDDPFDNHPLFKTEEQARLEETMDGEEPAIAESTPLAWPGDETAEHPVLEAPEATEAEAEGEDSGLWSKSRDFDWGD